jgi:hypothetical protein
MFGYITTKKLWIKPVEAEMQDRIAKYYRVLTKKNETIAITVKNRSNRITIRCDKKTASVQTVPIELPFQKFIRTAI